MSSCDTEVELSQKGYHFVDHLRGWIKTLENGCSITAYVRPDNRFYMRFLRSDDASIAEVYADTIDAGEIELLNRAKEYFYKQYQEINSLLNERNII